MTTEAAGSEVSTAEVNNGSEAYCVIGQTVNSSFGRTWKKTQADAVKHADRIINRSYDGPNGKRVQRLFVVKVVQVVEVAGPPITHRAVEADDFANQEDD